MRVVGGVYYNTNSPGVSFGNAATVNCHTPIWDQPFVSPHALWLTGMSGFKNPGDSQNISSAGCPELSAQQRPHRLSPRFAVCGGEFH